MVSCYIVIKSNILSAVLMILCYYCFVQLETAVKKTFPRKAYKRMKRRNHVGFIYKKFSKNRSLKNQHSSKAESSSLNVETEKQLALQYEFPIYQKILFKLNCFFSSEFFCCNFLSYIHCLIVHCLISFVCLVNSIWFWFNFEYRYESEEGRAKSEADCCAVHVTDETLKEEVFQNDSFTSFYRYIHYFLKKSKF